MKKNNDAVNVLLILIGALMVWGFLSLLAEIYRRLF